MDIRLDNNMQLTPAPSGDLLCVGGEDMILQDIRTEAVTQEGELFYDTGYGWSLLDFQHAVWDELTAVEVSNRIRTKLGNRDEVNGETIKVEVQQLDGAVLLRIKFRFVGSSVDQNLDVSLDRIQVEVVG